VTSDEPNAPDAPDAEHGYWKIHREWTLYSSDWVALHMADVERPDGSRIDHHLVRVPHAASATIVHVDGRVLVMWRHRFISDTWGWEIPAGKVDAGETPAEAAARETLEETGWQPGPLTHLVSYHPTNGLTDQYFHVFLATEATYVGEPSDPNEAARIEWLPVDEVADLLRRGEFGDGLSFSSVAWWLAVGR
jgi:8-oxo-dGTP pyrophosphatase MutT (NUDIX family)